MTNSHGDPHPSTCKPVISLCLSRCLCVCLSLFVSRSVSISRALSPLSSHPFLSTEVVSKRERGGGATYTPHIRVIQSLSPIESPFRNARFPKVSPAGEKSQQEAVLKATAVRSPLLAMLLILPCPPCLPQGKFGGRGVWWGREQGEGGPTGGGVWLGRGPHRGGGQGTFQFSCHTLHYLMVLRPEGTSHNKAGPFFRTCSPCVSSLAHKRNNGRNGPAGSARCFTHDKRVKLLFFQCTKCFDKRLKTQILITSQSG